MHLNLLFFGGIMPNDKEPFRSMFITNMTILNHIFQLVLLDKEQIESLGLKNLIKLESPHKVQ